VRRELPRTGKRRRTPALLDIPPVTGANTAHPSPVKCSSDSEENEVFFTPPTSRPRSAVALRSVLSTSVQPDSTRRFSFSKAEDGIDPGRSKSPARKVAFLDVSQPSLSSFKQLRRKGSKIMGIAGVIKDRRCCSKEYLVLPRGESPEILDSGQKVVQLDKLLKDNAALKSELQALRNEMQVMRDLWVARKDGSVRG
jgi:hypothetical protein